MFESQMGGQNSHYGRMACALEILNSKEWISKEFEESNKESRRKGKGDRREEEEGSFESLNRGGICVIGF
jgi:hypothetical protein